MLSPVFIGVQNPNTYLTDAKNADDRAAIQKLIYLINVTDLIELNDKCMFRCVFLVKNRCFLKFLSFQSLISSRKYLISVCSSINLSSSRKTCLASVACSFILETGLIVRRGANPVRIILSQCQRLITPTESFHNINDFDYFNGYSR